MQEIVSKSGTNTNVFRMLENTCDFAFKLMKINTIPLNYTFSFFNTFLSCVC